MTYSTYIILVGLIGAAAIVIGMPLGALLGERSTKDEHTGDNHE